MNIVEPILFQAKMNPDAVAICTPGTARETITYRALEGMINNIGRMALSSGLLPGNIVALHIKDLIFHAAAILGLARLGIVTVSPRTATLPKELGVQALIADAPSHFANVQRVIIADLGWTMGDGKPVADERFYRAGGDETCRITLTSGTTGDAKGVAFSHANVLATAARYDFAKGNRFPQIARLYCDLGITTGPAFRYLNYMLYRGGTLFLFGQDSASTAQAFNLFKVQSMVAAPSGLAEYVKFYEANGSFRCSFDNIICSGGLLQKSLSRRIASRMCPHLYNSYGASETGVVAYGPMRVLEDIPGAVGFVTPGAFVEVVDDDGTVLPIGREGHIRTRTLEMAKEYIGQPEASERVFRNGWFYPGDIGRLTADGLLVVVGRDNTVVNIGGDKVRPEVVEEALVTFRGIREAAVFTRTNESGVAELCAAIVSSAAVDVDALRAYCGQKLGPAFVPRRIILLDKLPRNEGGKVELHRLTALVTS